MFIISTFFGLMFMIRHLVIIDFNKENKNYAIAHVIECWDFPSNITKKSEIIDNLLNYDMDPTCFGIEITEKTEKEYLKNSKRYSVPEDCRSCVFYLNGCNGICAGCLQGGKNA